MREREPENDPDPLEQVGVAHGHALDDLLPEHGVNPQHGHRAAEEREVQERDEFLLRRELREHPRCGVDENRPDEGYVYQSRSHAMGNIDLYGGVFFRNLNETS